MNPVVGIDVAKDESEVQAFLEKGKPYVLMIFVKGAIITSSIPDAINTRLIAIIEIMRMVDNSSVMAYIKL
ncbi:hypothetical protein ABNX05_25825 [Lysinibacillus sp. M3]|uniref:IS110 family transposase n=1 Tax=Lysinibacillus zambalensis TaxID=3160866 RepID=A0ABV1MZS6_9BACI